MVDLIRDMQSSSFRGFCSRMERISKGIPAPANIGLFLLASALGSSMTRCRDPAYTSQNDQNSRNTQEHDRAQGTMGFAGRESPFQRAGPESKDRRSTA